MSLVTLTDYGANFSLKEGLFFKEKQRKSGSDERYLLLRTTPQPSAPNFFWLCFAP